MMNEGVAKQEGVLTIKSPFPDNRDMFNNQDPASFADAEIVIPGREKPLQLHRGILSRASEAFKGMFRCKASVHGPFSDEAQQINGFFEKTEGEGAEAFVQWLRFCYGAPLEVCNDNAVALLAMLPRLQLCNSGGIQKMLEDYIISAAKTNFETGAAMLCRSAHFEEFKSEQFSAVGKALAQIVFTVKNLTAHRETIVDKCLMQMPFEYLDVVQYGSLHTDISEFAIRRQYVLCNDEKLSMEMNIIIMKKCDWKKLNCTELKELFGLGVISKEELADLSMERLEKCEAHIKQLNAQMKEEHDKAQHYCGFFISCTLKYHSHNVSFDR